MQGVTKGLRNRTFVTPSFYEIRKDEVAIMWGEGRNTEQRKTEKKRERFFSRMRNSFQLRVLLSILLPIIIFCVLTNIVISTLLGRQLMEKREDVERGYLSVVYSYLEDVRENVDTLALLAENSSSVRWTMMKSGLDTMETKKTALAAQSSLLASLNGNPVSRYVDSMIIVNRQGMQIAVTDTQKIISAEEIFSSPLFQGEIPDGKARAALAQSVIDEGKTRLVYVYPLDLEENSYVYIELSTRLFTDVLEPYGDSSNIMIRSTNDELAWYSSENFKQQFESGGMKKGYFRDSMKFAPFSLSAELMIKNDMYTPDNIYILYVLLVIVLLVTALGITVSRIISSRITKPLRHLSGHISRLSVQNELTAEPSIEQGGDEIAGIGRAFNRLVRHINDLIREQKEMLEQKQRLEMNALQAQINPHFLYNTLDSIRWMAVIRKANNISDTIMSLENLLRNMAKGAGDQIPLREELSLARDYVNLQQVRYMGIFDYECEVPEELMDFRIVKMTLQPIIENAIFHGIEPTGTYGVIRVQAEERDGELYISVEDNGAGAESEELQVSMKERKNKNAMSGMGIGNVDERLKMTYGEKYGLICEGQKGKYTRITIHVPAEREEKEQEI